MAKMKVHISRVVLLSVIVVFVTIGAYMHQVKGGGPDGFPSVHALCPYGGLESLYSLFSSGSPLDKIYAGTISLFVITIVIAFIFKRGFCGWICPFGGLQELTGLIGKKMMKRQFAMPHRLDKYLRYVKYGVLAVSAVMAWVTATLWISPYDPWAAYAHLGEGVIAVWDEFAVGLVFLALTFVGSFFYDRFFCKYLCPMGAFLGIASKVGLAKISRNADTCIDCGLCTKKCPMNIDVAKAEDVRSAECINCQRCVETCPKKGALENRIAGSSGITLKPLAVGVGILLLYFGGIGVSALSGTQALLPGPVSESSVTVNDPDDLKGYMTLEDISTVMGLTIEEVYRRMEIPEKTPGDVPVKELSGLVPGFDFHEARERLRK
ncbi:MAG: 4Fe-4S binding protein [Spirochaetales bacterium]|nr:4Fe-4S binding protein [Spirochaetales bacterium]